MEPPDQSLTIHLYRKDEVLAAFRYAILSRNRFESVFWGLELFDSDMELSAIELLNNVWIREIGFGSWSAYKSIHDIIVKKVFDREEWIKLILAWCQIAIHDSTAYYILIRGSIEPVNWPPKFVHSKPYKTIQEACIDCLKRGKTMEAWFLARGISAAEQWAVLETVAELKGRLDNLKLLKSGKFSENDLYRRVAAFVLVGINNVLWANANTPLRIRPIPSCIEDIVADWDSMCSLRKRRIYSPRPEAILHTTRRSRLPTYQSFDDDLVVNLETQLWHSSYWNSVLVRAKATDLNDSGRLVWASDEDQMRFYHDYFTWTHDDIPDEWSKADREKSHGPGLGKDPQNASKMYIKRIFQRTKIIGVWKSTASEFTDDEAATEEHYEFKMNECRAFLESQLPLKPIYPSYEVTE